MRAREDLVVASQQNAELRSRLSEIEDLVEQYERAINVRDAELADLQAQLELSHRIRELGADNERAYTQYLTTLLRSQEPPLPDLGSIAEGLHLSERTLTRRLSGEGTSYRQVKNEVLRYWAQQYLLHTNHSVESVAASLGYQDAANFRRAFRKVEGCSPNEFRRREAAGE